MTTASHTHSQQMDCDWIAPYYKFLEHCSFGDQLEKRRFAFIETAKEAKRAIVCGGGDGRFLARLLRTNQNVNVDYVDLSPKMAALARERVVSLGITEVERVRFHICDLREFEPDCAEYDLIVTNFFLDCFDAEDVFAVVARLAAMAGPNAQWMVSEFCNGERRAARIFGRAIVRGLYFAFRMTTGLRVTKLPDYEAALSKADFVVRREARALGGLLRSSVWEKRQLGAVLHRKAEPAKA
jgi:SAM-dependent methyltransferase